MSFNHLIELSEGQLGQSNHPKLFLFFPLVLLSGKSIEPQLLVASCVAAI